MKLPLLRDAKDLHNKRVIVRVDFNVPIFNGDVRDDFRIERILPTLHALHDMSAKIILLSHHSEKDQSLLPVAEYLKDHLPVRFISDIYDKDAFTFQEEGEMLLCENLRFWEGEQKNDVVFAKYLASLGDVYVNDAFSVSHRKAASVVLLPTLLPSYMGFLFEREINGLSQVFNPPHPAMMILGGAKISSKLPLVENLLDTFDYIFVGGALANNFFRDEGCEVGGSLFEDIDLDFKALRTNPKIILPLDVTVLSKDGDVEIKNPHGLVAGDKILDAGPETITTLKEKIVESKFILMNGPIGDYEIPGFEKGTVELIKQIGKENVTSITGGGDSVALLMEAGLQNHFDFISTGGGAMLEFLINKTLPGIEVLRENKGSLI